MFARTAAWLAAAALLPAAAQTTRDAGLVIVTGDRSGTLPTTLPSTVETVTAAEIETRINASDAEDALKYLPSLLVRKRYIGDYNHAVLSSRASGTGNSARSMVYADGILLSNHLGNGAAFTPRWGLVAPEEIERVDVLYGPFSAAYAGNSVGAVVDYVTRMPRRFEAHVKAGLSVQPFELYGTRDTYRGRQSSAQIGGAEAAFAWWLALAHQDSESQPLTFATRLVDATTPAAGTPVDGALAGRDKSNQPWWLLGDGTQVRTRQDQAKVKLAWDIDEHLRALATLAVWRNVAGAQSHSYLTRQADGSVFDSGTAQIDGRDYALSVADFGQTRERSQHRLAGLVLRQRGDWEVALSRYDYAEDRVRMPTAAKPAADSGGAGRVTDLGGTGWDALALKGSVRPLPGHGIEGGLQQQRYRWRQRIDTLADWTAGDVATATSAYRGDTRLQSLYAQDTWAFAEAWRLVAGLRWERWRADHGEKTSSVSSTLSFAPRRETWVSPKLALGWQASEAWALKLSSGRAVRSPTVGELFQETTNPRLKPERSCTTELSSEWSTALQRWRATLFAEDTHDALYTQAVPGTTPIVTSVQNVDHIRSRGAETAWQGSPTPTLDLQAGATWADSTIVANGGYVALPGDTVGKQQPRVPKWRASALASWRMTPALTASYGLRYSSRQYGTLNNSDPNGFAYQAFSKYFTTDARLHWRFAPQWSAAVGVDNLNDATYWNFHPYPQRTYSAEMRFDL